MMYKENFIAVIKCNGKILREKGNVAYLPFGSEYSILLKNQESRNAVASIEIDGINVLSNNKLIIKGNSSQEVKGFMRNMKETNNFKFINKTKEIQDYRGDKIEDGFIRISYQFEAIKQELPILYAPTWGQNTYYFSSDTNYSDRLMGTSKSCGLGDVSSAYCNFNMPAPDEGITVKGSKVNVPYTYGSTNVLENTTHVIVLRLKGESVKIPMTVSTKITCETCGRKNRSNNNFCYNCGTNLS